MDGGGAFGCMRTRGTEDWAVLGAMGPHVCEGVGDLFSVGTCAYANWGFLVLSFLFFYSGFFSGVFGRTVGMVPHYTP